MVKYWPSKTGLWLQIFIENLREAITGEKPPKSGQMLCVFSRCIFMVHCHVGQTKAWAKASQRSNRLVVPSEDFKD